MKRPTPRQRVAFLLTVLGVCCAAAWWLRDPMGGHHHHHHGRREGPPLPKLAVTGTLSVAFETIAAGFVQPTDLQWVAGQNIWIVLEKAGTAWWLSADGKSRGKLLHVETNPDGEQGLLGLALHPQFAKNGRFFLNYVVGSGAKKFTRIAQWHVAGDVRTAVTSQDRVVFDIPQEEFSNHKGGQLQFGPDGMLYIGMGDGGAGGDPHGNAQNPGQLLGKMLRIDVDHQDPGLGYAVPPDNPFVGRAGYRPEIWALGVRNPWRFSFDPKGRLIVADVGQNTWEELDVVAKGDNLGWNVREGRHCFLPPEGCTTTALHDPVVEYSADEGRSITGGYVALGAHVTPLRGKYVLADFVTGALWAVALPESASATARVWSLGTTDHHIATFGRDADGDLFAADVATGEIVRLNP